MEESFISLQLSKENPKRRFSLFRGGKKKRTNSATKADEVNRQQQLASTSAEYDNRDKRNKEKKCRVSGWKSFFHVFTKSNSINATLNPKKRNLCNESTSQELNELQILNHTSSAKTCASKRNSLFLNGNDDSLAMAITLPVHVKGSDVKVSIELKAIAKGNEEIFGSDNGLSIRERTEKYSTYSGTLKVPMLTTILEVSKMPLYLLSGDFSPSERKVETIIKPIDNILPERYDRNMIVDEINLKLKFENINNTPNLFYNGTLNYIFLTNGLLMKSLEEIKTEDLVDQITEEAVVPYKESSKMLVKEILNQVVSKISLNSSVDLIEDFHKELEVQKSLLLETSSSILPKPESLLSKISESEQEEFPSATKISSYSSMVTSDSSLYAKSTTPCVVNNDSDTKYQLQVPANTPDIFMPKYVILQGVQDLIPCNNENVFGHAPNCNYISKRWPNKKSIRDEVKADIDRTLELLETAKNKLLCYLNQTSLTELQTQKNNFRTTRRDTYCDLMPIEMMLSSVEDVLEQTSNSINIDPFKIRSQSQFFLGAPEEKTENLLCSSGNLMQNTKDYRIMQLETNKEYQKSSILKKADKKESSLLTEMKQVEATGSKTNFILIKKLLEEELIDVPKHLCHNPVLDKPPKFETTKVADISLGRGSVCVIDGFDSVDKIELSQSLNSQMVQTDEVANSDTDNQTDFSPSPQMKEENIEEKKETNPLSNDANQQKEEISAPAPIFENIVPVNDSVEVENIYESIENYTHKDDNKEKAFEKDYDVDILHRIETRNDRVFKKRYSESARDIKVSYSVIENDIDIMIRELMDESNAIKQSIISKIGDTITTENDAELDPNNMVYEDVKSMLDMILNKVDEKIIMKKLQKDIGMGYGVKQVYQVNPVYFCLIDDFVDVFPTAGCSDNKASFYWVANKFRSKIPKFNPTSTGCSTISVRRIPSGAPINSSQVPTLNVDGLLETLEKGASYVSELYKEIYTRPMSILKFGKYNNTSLEHRDIAMVKDLVEQPLIRRSSKILKFAKKHSEQLEEETGVEKIEKIINASNERKREKSNDKNANNGNNRRSSGFSGIVSWNMFTNQFRYSETNEAVRRLPEVINCSLQLTTNMAKKDMFGKEKSSESNDKSTESNQKTKKQQNDKPTSSSPPPGWRGGVKINSVTNTKEFDQLTLPTSDEVIHNQVENKTTMSKISEKKSLKSLINIHVNPEEEVDPVTSQDHHDLEVFHEEDLSSARFESSEQLLTVAYDFDTTKVHMPVADIPRVYDSSEAEVLYMQNIKVLQNKFDSDRCGAYSLITSSSSESKHSIQSTVSVSKHKMLPKTNSNFSTMSKLTEISDVNRLDYSTDASVVSSRSDCSRPVSTDYDGDNENLGDILPRFRVEYASQQELNEPEEIAKIEENVLKNYMLNPQAAPSSSQESEMRKNKRKKPIISLSEESMPTSISLESPSSEIELI